MSRYRISLEYQGTRYRGWQIQKNARTVQGEIHKALERVLGDTPFEFQGAGRTDAGVHALEQVAHLEAEDSLPPETLHRRLNDELPADINILSVERASPRFHARHLAVSRSYLYQIATRRTALGKNLVWWVREKLDTDRMREGAQRFVGMKDYRSFTDDEPGEKSTRVLVDRVEVKESGALILIRIEGSHFLWKMVRRMVGVLVEVGKHALSPDEVARFLEERSDQPAKWTAPASGLFLERVYYEGEARLQHLGPVIQVRRVP
jgi:tRNA pseudouridine38-40 synthase